MKHTFPKMREFEIKAFQCIECGINIEVGHCGEHRINTGHKRFEEVEDDP